jgi:hypothetical protein
MGMLNERRPFFIPIPLTLVYFVKKSRSPELRNPIILGTRLPPPGVPS